MTPDQISQHMLRVQAAVRQARGNPVRALAIAGAAMAPITQALNSETDTERQLAKVRELMEAVGAEITAKWMVTILAIIGNGLQPPQAPPNPDTPIGEMG